MDLLKNSQKSLDQQQQSFFNWKFDEIAKFSAVGFFLTFPVALGLANTLLAVALLGWVLAGGYKQRFIAIKKNSLSLPLFLLYAWILIGGIYADALFDNVLLHYSKYSKLLLAVLLISLLDDVKWRRRCWLVFSLSMLFILVSVYANIWFTLPWSATNARGWGVDHHVIGDYITQNVMMSFFVILLVQYARSEKALVYKCVLYTIAFLAVLSITHLSLGRTGYVLLAVASLVFAIVTTPPRRRLMVVGLVGCLLLVALFTSKIITQRFELAVVEAKRSDVDYVSSIGHRLYNYKKTPELILKNPILGSGTGSYHTQICKVIDDPEMCYEYHWHPHNQYIFFWVNNGIIGVGLFIFLIFRFAKIGAQAQKNEAVVFWSFLAILVVDSMFNSPLWSARENHFFVFMMALMSASVEDVFQLPVRGSSSLWRESPTAADHPEV